MLSKHSLWRYLRNSRHVPVSYCARSNFLKGSTNQCKDLISESGKESIQDGVDFTESAGRDPHAKQRGLSDGTRELGSDSKISRRNADWFERTRFTHLCNQLEHVEVSGLKKDTQKRIINYDRTKVHGSVAIDLPTYRFVLPSNRIIQAETHIVRQYHTKNMSNKVKEDEKAREIDDLAETENQTSVLNISESENRLPEEFDYQETSVWEEIIREKENLELDIPETVEEENPIFPALPVIKPQSDVLSEETVLTEYQPDRQRKVAFPTKIYNFAPLVNQSETLRELVKLGVDLSEVEKTSMADKIIKMNFKKDIKPYLLFLNDLGVAPDDFGKVLTTTPYLFQEDIKTLKVRINYFKSKKFKREDVASMVTKNAKFLLMSIERIDAKLGFYQRCFKLKGSEVRQLAVQSPKNLIVHEDWIKKSKFRLSEYLGFTEMELKKMVLNYPKLFFLWPFQRVDDVFNILHHKMDIPHSLMVVWPKVFESSPIEMEQRHRFLLKVDRAQYDPTKENYVSLERLVATKDDVFCIEIAQASVMEYYNFLKMI